MRSYIALLRGINVSGHHIILMKDLRNSFESLGFSKVTSYLQSGNVVFCSKIEEPSQLENAIQSCILKDYGYSVKVIVVSKQELEHVYASNPFTENKGLDIKKLCVVFLGGSPDLDELDIIIKNPNFSEELMLIKNVIYMHFPDGIGKAKVSNNYLEKKLKVSATTRNWRTVTNINGLLNGL